jgi:hypothetical protein
LSNGTERSVRTLLRNAGIEEYFESLLSGDRIRTFKLDPAVYALLQAVAVEPAQRKKHCARGGSIWYPEETIREELDNGQLKPLPPAEGGERVGMLYLM